MLKVDFALIGGTGIGSRLAKFGGRPLLVPTPHGAVRGKVVEIEGLQAMIVQRHAHGHRVPPHAVNYEATAEGLRRLGAKACLSTAAVGSLREDWPVGAMARCADFLDATGRGTTLFESDVRHTDFSSPFPLAKNFSVEKECVYACMPGPRYETPFEVGLLRRLGADVVGMTAANEAIAMREAGVPYGCLAIVTNLGCGIGDQELSHDEVGDVMEQNGDKAVELLIEAARRSV